ncbi:MAG: chemotaxis protein CheW [Woeseiaceae bacterium]
MANNNSNILVDEKVAISLFLDSLLTEPEEITETVSVEPAPEIIIKEEDITLKVIPDIKPEVKKAEVKAGLVVEPEVKTQINKVVEAPSAIPSWANEPFQVLLFKVAGLQLAVPLIELSSVIEWSDAITEMPGHADFYMGLLQHLNYKIAVVDTAKLVFPLEKLQELSATNAKERVKHIVLIDDYRWGLACDCIGEVITLKPEEVKWRADRSKRAWLAGTVIDHMCALLSSDGFSEMLKVGRES